MSVAAQLAGGLELVARQLDGLRVTVRAADADAQRSAIADAIERLVTELYNLQSGGKTPEKLQRFLEGIEAWERAWRTDSSSPMTTDELVKLAKGAYF